MYCVFDRLHQASMSYSNLMCFDSAAALSCFVVERYKELASKNHWSTKTLKSGRIEIIDFEDYIKGNCHKLAICTLKVNDKANGVRLTNKEFTELLRQTQALI